MSNIIGSVVTRLVNPMPIIVKFKNYNAKREVYAAKSNLKVNPEKIFMIYMTKQNHKIVSSLLTKVNAKSMHSFRTIDGKIFIKDDESADPKEVPPVAC